MCCYRAAGERLLPSYPTNNNSLAPLSVHSPHFPAPQSTVVAPPLTHPHPRSTHPQITEFFSFDIFYYVVIGYTDLPSRLPTQASTLYSNNISKVRPPYQSQRRQQNSRGKGLQAAADFQ